MNDDIKQKQIKNRIDYLKERVNESMDMMVDAERSTSVMDPYQRAQDALTKLFILLVTGKAL